MDLRGRSTCTFQRMTGRSRYLMPGPPSIPGPLPLISPLPAEILPRAALPGAPPRLLTSAVTAPPEGSNLGGAAGGATQVAALGRGGYGRGGAATAANAA